MSANTVAIQLRVWSVLPFCSIQSPPKRQKDDRWPALPWLILTEKRKYRYAKRIIPCDLRWRGFHPRERKRDRPRAEEAPARWRGDTWQLDRRNNREWDRRPVRRQKVASRVDAASAQTEDRANRQPTAARTATASTTPRLGTATACRPRTTRCGGASARGIRQDIPGRI